MRPRIFTSGPVTTKTHRILHYSTRLRVQIRACCTVPIHSRWRPRVGGGTSTSRAVVAIKVRQGQLLGRGKEVLAGMLGRLDPSLKGAKIR